MLKKIYTKINGIDITKKSPAESGAPRVHIYLTYCVTPVYPSLMVFMNATTAAS